MATDGTSLSGVLSGPPDARVGVVVCHPHPHFGGSMATGLVRRIATEAAERGRASLRFDFRGVGESDGASSADHAEVADAMGAVAFLRAEVGPIETLVLVGYSFGAWVAAHAVAQGAPVERLALIAPPLAAPGRELPPVAVPTVCLCGESDPHCPIDALVRWCSAVGANWSVLPGADHFLAGREAEVAAWIP